MTDLTARHLARLNLASVRRWNRTPFRPGALEMLERQRNRKTTDVGDDGLRIWWPKSAGLSCTARHGFSRAPVAQVDGALFNRRPGFRQPLVPFRRWALDYDLPF